MASKKKGQLTKYCRIFQWVQAKDPDFAGAIRDLCLELHSNIRQEYYNAGVRLELRKEYLRLAGGNEEVAKAFWAKAEGTAWPSNEEIEQYLF